MRYASATHKDLKHDLERAARRAETMGRKPATGKQCWYLASLMETAGDNAAGIGCSITNTSATLTSGQASRYIADYQGEATRDEQAERCAAEAKVEREKIEAEEAAHHAAIATDIRVAVATHPELVTEYRAAYAETESKVKNARKKARQKLITRMREAMGQPGLQHHHLRG